MSPRLLIAFVLLGACVGPETGNNNRKKDMGTSGNPDGFIDFIDMARNTTSCTGGGSVCSSVNPGKCDPGIVTCDGQMAMCTPNSVVQDCYDGPPQTVGVGICTAGQQSCIGILGPCNGQILPLMKEDCSNDADDDCDGKINNTCPDALQLGLPRYPSPLAPATPPANANQMNMEKRCPTGGFVNRVQIQFDDPHLQLVGLQFTCATPTLIKPVGGSTTYSLGTMAVMPAPYDDFIGAGATVTGTPIDMKCSGIGLQGIVSMHGRYDVGSYIGMFAKCGLATAAIQPDNTLKITVNPTGAEQGYDYGPLIGTNYGTAVSWACNNNEVIVGFKGVVSQSIDQLQPVCEPINPVYKL
jgi:hypothetical protein